MAEATNNPVQGTNNIPVQSNVGGFQSANQNTAQTLQSGKIFTAFDPDKDIVSDVIKNVTATMWSTGIGGTMYDFYTYTTQVSASGDYFYNIYQEDPTGSNAAIQFAVAFGHVYGSGSVEINSGGGDTSMTPSKAIYSQYRNVLLSGTTEQFTLESGKSVTNFYAVNFQRERLKERIDPGNWEMYLNGTVLIDDYTGLENGAPQEAGEVFNILSGSVDDGLYTDGSGNYVYAGIMYPDHGVLLIDGDFCKDSASIDVDETEEADSHANNITEFVNAMTASGDDTLGFSARNVQKVTSTYYFVRVKNYEYNFSNNPSFTSGSLGTVRNGDMINDPTTYITGVGLYNNDNELLAVSKISLPIKKAFDRETTIRIKVDF